jgi:hypothetical protein
MPRCDTISLDPSDAYDRRGRTNWLRNNKEHSNAHIIVIYEAPDAIASAALAMTLGASGGFSSIKTTSLLTTADAIKAMKLSAETKAAYKPPSK